MQGTSADEEVYSERSGGGWMGAGGSERCDEKRCKCCDCDTSRVTSVPGLTSVIHVELSIKRPPTQKSNEFSSKWRSLAIKALTHYA